MQDSNLAATVAGNSTIEIAPRDIPEPGEGEITVEMRACGICGSDLEKVFGSYGKGSTRLGHEPAGVITAVGSSVSGLAVGDRVFTHHHVGCGSCHLCRHGSHTLCTKYSMTNLDPCGLSQRYMVPAWNVTNGGVLKLPDSMTFEEAALIEPLACCVRAWKKIRFQQNDIAAVLGAGSTGIMHAMIARKNGFSQVLCMDINRFRLEFASKMGAATSVYDPRDPDLAEKVKKQTGGTGVDVAIVATGSMTALDTAINLVRPGGTVMMFGVPSSGATLELRMDRVYAKETTLLTSYAASEEDTTEALMMISSGDMDAKSLVTHDYPLRDAQRAFEHARSGQEAMKIVITSSPEPGPA